MSKKPKKLPMPKPTTVDFETWGIESRPAYPPIPTGVSIKKWGKPAKYYSWGHPTENNCSWGEGQRALAEAWACPDGVLFQNGKFDVDVAETHMGMPVLDPLKVHDSIYLIFLDNPHEKELGLKESAKRLLDMEPEERDAVADWLVDTQPVPGIKIGKGRNSKEPAGKYIALAPGKLVGAYADGDAIRTEKVFEKLWPKTQERGMLAAYDRERQLMPILLESERNGIRVDLERLEADVKIYTGWQTKIDAWIRISLGNPVFPKSKGSSELVELNVDSGQQLAEALINKGFADPALMGLTPGGSVKTDKAALANGVTNKVLGAVLKYRAQLKTCVNTFLITWLDMARQSGGRIFTNWNQVKAVGGTRTGRLSSTPNFQNVPKVFDAIFLHEEPTNKKLPKCPWKDLPSLPMCRGYIVPYADDHILINRDYSQQEPRILGHFEDGDLKEQYRANPWIDFHDNAKENLERIMGRPYLRKPVKNINLGIIYGQGLGSLAEKNGSTVQETKDIRDSILRMYPGLGDLQKDMKFRYKNDLPIRTWGGREVYCEPPALVNGRVQHFDYKMVNYLIQGSAADCTKEAMIRFHVAKRLEEIRLKRKLDWYLLLQVHDEIVLSAPRDEAAQAMELLRQAMESVEFDVQILSEGGWSAESWREMRDYDKKGQLVDVF